VLDINVEAATESRSSRVGAPLCMYMCEALSFDDDDDGGDGGDGGGGGGGVVSALSSSSMGYRYIMA
jgi:hypothetical protein